MCTEQAVEIPSNTTAAKASNGSFAVINRRRQVDEAGGASGERSRDFMYDIADEGCPAGRQLALVPPVPRFDPTRVSRLERFSSATAASTD